MRDESEKEVIHRLEAFSDIVIGFSLAQLSLSLRMPEHVVDMFTGAGRLSTIGAFVITFTLVCSLWWLHHKLFRHLFVPTPANIAVNFAALGGVLFYAYAMQVLINLKFHDPYGFALYFGCYAYITLLFAYLAWYGLRAHGADLPAPIRTEQGDLAGRLAILGLGFTGITVMMLLNGGNSNLGATAIVFVFIPLLIQRALIRRRKMRAAQEG